MPEPLVRESKYVAEWAAPESVSALLGAYSEPDPAHAEGEIESVYWDTRGLASFAEKANGDSLKRKVRLRWYRDTPPSSDGRRVAFFEVKDRIGAARDKVRAVIRWDAGFLDSAPLCDPAFADLLRVGADAAGFGFLPLGALVPVVSIRYRRRRFVCPATDSRLSVDWNLSCPRANRDVFPLSIPLGTPEVVVEAKSSGVRAWPFGPALVRAGFRLCSFSKFGLFLSKLNDGSFS